MRLVAILRRGFLVGWVLSLLLICGCGGSGSSGSGQSKPALRFFNACTDSIALNFLLNDDVAAAQFAYLQSSSAFQDEDDDTYDLRLLEDGTSEDIWSEVVTLAKDKSYLITAIGIKNYGAENLKRLRFMFSEINRAAPNGSRARIIILHAYNRAAGFDTPNVDFQTPGDNPQFKSSDIGYGTIKFLEVDAGNQTYEVRRAGTENILFSQNITLGGGKMYVAYLVGVEGEVGAAAPKIEFVEIETE